MWAHTWKDTYAATLRARTDAAAGQQEAAHGDGGGGGGAAASQLGTHEIGASTGADMRGA